MANVELGLGKNWRQFSLLVLVNAFVGAMVGIERTIFPQLASEVFGIAAATATLSFIIAFGVVKALANYFTGALAARWGRRRLLIAGWIIGLPVPVILLFAPSWGWIVFANVLLGINQGLTWSSTVMMKIDLVGPKKRGLAMGLNEFAGYLAVALMAFVTGLVASRYGVRPYPFVIGIFIAITGLLISLIWVKDTHHHAALEESGSRITRLQNPFWQTTWKNPNLGAVTQAGLVNNLNDGMVWGLLPMLLLTKGFSLAQTGTITAVYPAVWGLGQLITGSLADKTSKKRLLFFGMLLQAVAILLLPFGTTLYQFILLSAALGWGTAMVYPTFLASIADYTHPADRPKSLGTFRFWRDLGYAIGALLTGLVADRWGMQEAILVVGILTFISALIIQIRMSGTSQRPAHHPGLTNSLC